MYVLKVEKFVSPQSFIPLNIKDKQLRENYIEKTFISILCVNMYMHIYNTHHLKIIINPSTSPADIILH